MGLVLEAPLVNKIVFDQAKKLVDKQAHGNYPAPYRILECVEIGWNQGMEKGLDAEDKIRRAYLVSCFASVNQYLFCHDRQKEKSVRRR